MRTRNTLLLLFVFLVVAPVGAAIYLGGAGLQQQRTLLLDREAQVLNGAHQIASGASTMFLLQMHSIPDMTLKENAGRVMLWCALNRYRAWTLEDNSDITSTEQFAGIETRHLLLLPSQMEFPAYLNPDLIQDQHLRNEIPE